MDLKVELTMELEICAPQTQPSNLTMFSADQVVLFFSVVSSSSIFFIMMCTLCTRPLLNKADMLYDLNSSSDQRYFKFLTSLENSFAFFAW